MKLELSPRDRAVAIPLAVTLVALALAVSFGIYGAQRHLHQETDDLRSRLQATATELEAAAKERASLAEEIQPLRVWADRQFPGEPAAQRFPLLVGRLEAMTKAMSQARGRRRLTPAAAARIRAKLEEAPGLAIEIGGVWPDPEATALAEDLRTVFESAGLKPRPLAQYLAADNIPAGVAVYSKHQLDGVLSGAIAQIFLELDQPAVQWLEADVELTGGAALAAQPDLKIIVGRR